MLDMDRYTSHEIRPHPRETMNRGLRTDVALRPWSNQDLPLLERLRSAPAMNEHLGGPETPGKIRERHERYRAMADTGEGRMFVIVIGPPAEPVGSVGYREREWEGKPVWEMGWNVLPEFQGRGIATRAVATAIERARAERKHRFVHAFPSVDNLPSNAVCRKVGFTLVGEVDFEYPPGIFMRSNDWSFDLSVGADASSASS
jgi:RimJ/RimL family protein N-acetyltransferase